MASVLAEKLAVMQAFAERNAAASLDGYLFHLTIDSRPEPRPFRLVAKPWQWELIRGPVAALEDVAGVRRGYAGPRNFWRTLPRGHDKTGSIARLCSWVLAFGKQSVTAVAAAGDRDQAGLLRDSMLAEAKLNPWLMRRLRFNNWNISGPGGKLTILAADAGTAYGLKPDLVVCDELTHWKRPDLWDALWSGRQKRPGSVYIVITNAGIIGSWQHDILNSASVDPSWDIYEAPGRLDTWMDEAAVAKDRALLPSLVARRVFDNQWINQSIDSVWTEWAWARMEAAHYDVQAHWPVVIGCDVARFGDDATAAHVRQGMCSIHHETWRGVDTGETARRLRRLANRFAGEGKDPKRVAVQIDAAGLGVGVLDQAEGYNFVGVVSAERSRDQTRYPNLRCELWFCAMELAQQGLIDVSRLPQEVRNALRNQLFSPNYWYDAAGRRVVEQKAETKRRIKRSPDDADAFNLAYLLAQPVQETVAGYT